jgi:hypothetical protein
MIIVKTEGGLGNQMFQYAFGKNLSIKYKKNYYLDTTWYFYKFFDQTPRNFELDKFQVSEINYLSKSKKFLNKIILIFSRKIKILQKIYQTEEQFHFNSKLKLNFFANYFTGYWQSYKYFDSIKVILQREFVPCEIDERSYNIIQKIKESYSLSIHIRRGDYVTNKNTHSFHGVCELNYYEEAIELIQRKRNEINLICIFSDDIDWVKQNLFIERIDVIYVSEIISDHIQEFEIMKQCHHNIIANSSFSWWSAYLNSNPEKIVIAPKKWFNDLSINTSDLFPKDWLLL